MFRTAGDRGAAKLTLLGALTWSFVSKVPQRLGRIALDGRRAVTGVLGWLSAGFTGTRSRAETRSRAGGRTRTLATWLGDGLRGGSIWSGLLLLHLVELAGLGELLQLLWGLIFRLRPLTDAERAASATVHPAGLIPYWQVWVHDDAVLIKIGRWLASRLKTKVTPCAITSMHIVHAPATGLNMPLVVHELTHVGQYEKVGAAYMPEALHAQGSAAGYDYGDLTAARAAGARFADFNREQQASICADYYRVCHGGSTEFGATKAELAPFVDDLRSGRL